MSEIGVELALSFVSQRSDVGVCEVPVRHTRAADGGIEGTRCLGAW